MFKTKAMVHSLKALDEATILHQKGPNDIVAEYKGKRCTAIFNPFSCLYYVDDVYGVLTDRNKCPNCAVYIPDTEQEGTS